MLENKTDIFVYAHWEGMSEPVFIGILYAQHVKGRKSFSFKYDENWLKGNNVFLLDPEIKLFSGTQFPNNRDNFGIFLDSMPDTWGRTLMRKRASQIAKEKRKSNVILQDIDFLLGVTDTCRMGALRFKLSPDGPFLADDSKTPVPPWSSVSELQYIARLTESDKNSKELDNWLKMLVAPGSSLGGARPKANILDNRSNLWIAKFPAKNDTIDKAKWEFLAYKLALASGITMSESKIEKVAGNYHTFFTKRFDRINGERIHFASAMTMTGNTEETIKETRASYIDLALFISDYSGKINNDLSQLWRRIVFNIAISNTDDHLRNHGFIVENKSWRLSPAFDINPSIDKEELALNIDDSSGELDFGLAIDVAEYFRLKKHDAFSIMSEVRNTISNWEKLAKTIKISRVEIDLMRPAFRF
ncbi:MAG: HipA domain-containing protein [Bacteroidales bacterium]|nr:HipA domain-containing protein [Bacteroidales bacterium]